MVSIRKKYSSLNRPFKIALWVIGAFLVYCVAMFVLVKLTYHPSAPNVTYSVGEADCSTISKVKNYCDISITVTNQEDKHVDLEYVDTGGGPLSGVTFRMRIYAANGKFCSASPVEEPRDGYYTVLEARESRVLTLMCAGSEKDSDIDARPAYVLVDYYGNKDRIDLNVKK